MLKLWQAESPDLLMTYIEAVDSSSHLFGHLFRATGLAGKLAEQQRRYGDTVEQMYLLADRIVGRYLDALGNDGRLVVLSDHGFKLGTLHEDPSRASDMRRVSAAFHRMEGVLYLYGRGIRPGVRLEQPSILDVAPTVLALAGIPPASDMPGRVLERALVAAAPAERVVSYENGAQGEGAESAGSTGSDAAPVDAAILEHLRSLGYLDTASPSGDRNMAGIHFEAGRYKEAAEEYRKLIKQHPEDGSLHASLAGALGASGDFDGALAELDEAERIAPDYALLYQYRANVAFLMRDRERARAALERALELEPDNQLFRQNLEALDRDKHLF